MDVQVKGLTECLNALKELDSKVQKSILRKGLRAGAKIVLAAAKADAPERTGRLKRNLKVRGGKSGKGKVGLTVGASAKDFTGPAFYASFLEYGYHTRPRKTSISTASGRKPIEGQHFLLKAYEQTKEDALDAVVQTWTDLIEQATNGGK
jgi:HK97 gp10 family phage protein